MRLKVLNGAPLCANLDFSRDALLDPRDRDQTFTNFLSGVVLTRPSCMQSETSAQAKWRHVTATCTRLRTGWSQPYLPAGGIYAENPNLSFSIPNLGPSLEYAEQDSRFDDTTFTLDTTPGVGDFLQHSLLLHDTLLSSQVALDARTDSIVSSSSFFSTSFDTVTTQTSNPATEQVLVAIAHVPSTLTVSSLDSFPSAQQLRAIYPQTPTRNLVCVLTSQPEHRQVIVRKGGYKMYIYETIMADNTKSGFKVSFWFRPPRQTTQDAGQNKLRGTLERARVGDILLLRNVVLSVYRDNVYGQSLNSSIARARTTVETLRRGDGLSTAPLSALPAAVGEVFVRVKRWANVHVVPDYVNSRKRKGTTLGKRQPFKRLPTSSDWGNEILPPDTMETCLSHGN